MKPLIDYFIHDYIDYANVQGIRKGQALYNVFYNWCVKNNVLEEFKYIIKEMDNDNLFHTHDDAVVGKWCTKLYEMKY